MPSSAGSTSSPAELLSTVCSTPQIGVAAGRRTQADGLARAVQQVGREDRGQRTVFHLDRYGECGPMAAGRPHGVADGGAGAAKNVASARPCCGREPVRVPACRGPRRYGRCHRAAPTRRSRRHAQNAVLPRHASRTRDPALPAGAPAANGPPAAHTAPAHIHRAASPRSTTCRPIACGQPAGPRPLQAAVQRLAPAGGVDDQAAAAAGKGKHAFGGFLGPCHHVREDQQIATLLGTIRAARPLGPWRC